MSRLFTTRLPGNWEMEACKFGFGAQRPEQDSGGHSVWVSSAVKLGPKRKGNLRHDLVLRPSCERPGAIQGSKDGLEATANLRVGQGLQLLLIEMMRSLLRVRRRGLGVEGLEGSSGHLAVSIEGMTGGASLEGPPVTKDDQQSTFPGSRHVHPRPVC